MYSEWGFWVSLAVESKAYHYLEEGKVALAFRTTFLEIWDAYLTNLSPSFHLESGYSCVVDSPRPFQGGFVRKKRLQSGRSDTPMVNGSMFLGLFSNIVPLSF